MILAKQQEENRNNIEINILNFNEEQNKLNNNDTSFSSFKNNNLNSVKISNQNDNMKNSLIMKQDNNSKILNSTTLNGKTNENVSSSSTQSSNSPGSSSSTTSRESANVFKFRTLLSSPSGSQVFRIIINFPAIVGNFVPRMEVTLYIYFED
ncbi:unnamed protein product [Meloidogyne enterolobii]|uniref:Uncharacterized protein n=1 Tax=Meloidogyne enterolobii TaxID=390850 RepID=A0ACB0YBS7_MELEN